MTLVHSIIAANVMLIIFNMTMMGRRAAPPWWAYIIAWNVLVACIYLPTQ